MMQQVTESEDGKLFLQELSALRTYSFQELYRVQ
jgi:hypothetical protein